MFPLTKLSRPVSANLARGLEVGAVLKESYICSASTGQVEVRVEPSVMVCSRALIMTHNKVFPCPRAKIRRVVAVIASVH